MVIPAGDMNARNESMSSNEYTFMAQRTKTRLAQNIILNEQGRRIVAY